MKIILIILAAMLTSLFGPQAYAAKSVLVLVAVNHSVITQLTPEEVRRLYVGIPIEVGGHAIEPLVNASDSLLQEIFMQQVLFMSTEAYTRQNESGAYRKEVAKTPVYTEMPALIAALKANPYAVTYMLKVTAATLPDLKIIAELWRSEE